MRGEVLNTMSLTHGEKKRLVDSYSPHPETLIRIRDRKLGALFGGTAAGKTTLFAELARLFPDDYAMVQNETSRRPAEGEEALGELTFLTENEAINDIEARRLLQVVLGANDDFYFTRPADYPKGKTGLMAVMYEVLPIFQQLPFKEFKPVYIVSEFSTWMHRVKKQAQVREWSDEKYWQRLKEADESLSAAYDDNAIPFLVNDELAPTVQALHRYFSEGLIPEQDRARDIAANNRLQLKGMLSGR